MALNKDLKTNIIKKYARDEKDTGSAEVQIAILSEEIKILTEHLKEQGRWLSSKARLSGSFEASP